MDSPAILSLRARSSKKYVITVRPSLIFLHLLECDPQPVREVCLRHSYLVSPHPDALAHVNIDRVRAPSAHFASAHQSLVFQSRLNESQAAHSTGVPRLHSIEALTALLCLERTRL